MTYEEAETLLGQAVALNIIAETCSRYNEKCLKSDTDKEICCPFLDERRDNCILSMSVVDKLIHVEVMESKALSILNKERNDFNDTRGKN